jgi:integrase
MGSKRSNGEGSIYWNEKRKRYEAAIVVGYSDGRPVRRRFVGKTRRDVTTKLDAAKAALDQGLPVPNNQTTVAEFTGQWIEKVLPGEGLAPATEHFYRDVLNRYVLPTVGTKTLTGPRALTPADVEAMTASLAEKGYSHRVCIASRTVLGKVLRAAEGRGFLGRNVARLAKRPGDSGKPRVVKAYTVDEVQKLVAAMKGTRWHPIVVLGVTTGLRPGELLALHWTDVQLDGTEPRVSVRLAVSHVDGVRLKKPKRDRSYRSVPLVPEAVAALRSWRKRQAKERLRAGAQWSTEWPELVFTNESGEPQRVDSYRRELSDAYAGAHPHRLRHTYATHLLEASPPVPIHHVAELLGDTVATVESTYSHVLRPKFETVGVARQLVAGAS